MDIAGQDAELPEIRHRSQVLSLIVTVVFLALGVRLFYLQVIEGDNFYRMTAENIIRTVPLPATRGQIRDRKGRVFATMVPSYDIEVLPSQITRESYDRLRALLGPDVERMLTWEAIQAEATKGKDRTLVAAENVSRDVMAQLETSLDKPGIHVAAVQRRHYPNGTTAAHSIGYLNEVSAEELKTRKDEGYQAGDTIGRTGIERQWEPYLRGQKGFEKVVVNRRGLRRTDVHISDLVTDGPVSQSPSPGNNVILTLDLDVQRIVERALRSVRSAAAVVVDVETGRILAIASKPAFDPNMMSGGLSPENIARVLSDRLRPFRDKALSDTFNPGSTFTAITAMSGLEEKVIVPEDKVKCGGYIQVGRRRFRCTKAHKTVNLYDAIVQSCNVFFYDLGGRPGMMNRMAKYAADFGLGAPTGLGLNGEQAGFIPTEMVTCAGGAACAREAKATRAKRGGKACMGNEVWLVSNAGDPDFQPQRTQRTQRPEKMGFPDLGSELFFPSVLCVLCGFLLRPTRTAEIGEKRPRRARFARRCSKESLPRWSRPCATIAWMKRPCATWSTNRSAPASTAWFPWEPPANRPPLATRSISESSRWWCRRRRSACPCLPVPAPMPPARPSS